ncbi:hypothetical protein [Frankia sp. Cppng1_Ct_nod]|uniref:hypothetical protein n=1 Tax=Frankia sp. Cppng1_Ct_nod TaxID=2897162 RepID=UPI0020241097|nr:hypothetical protein [Frankia sp. Cppng1_Ct_nod]
MNVSRPDLPGPGSSLPDLSGPGPLRRHALIAVLVAMAGALRVLAMAAYRPALEFSGDSYAYLRLARPLVPDPVRPAGYPLLLRALSATGRLWVVPAVQHATGVALGLAVYALMAHRGVARPVAALAAAPVLLDAYQMDIEHFVMAETLFEALVVAGVVALLWAPRPSLWACGFAGGCLALASLVRTVGVALGMLALVYILVRRFGWSRSVAFTGVLAVPLIGYASWFHSAHGTYALTGGDTYWLYGRVAPIADCARLDLTAQARQLCSPHPPRERPGPNYYVWNHNSPRFTISVPDGEKEAVLADFAHQVIRHQPVDYTRMVTGEVAHYFTPGRWVGPRDWYVGTWQFPADPVPAYWHNNAPLMTFNGGRVARAVAPGPAAFLRAYQRYGFTPGPALGAMAVLGVAAVSRRRPKKPRPWPSRRRKPRGSAVGLCDADRHAEDRRIRADCALLVTAGMALLVIPSTTVCFDYRYLLPTLVLFPPAAALALRAIAHDRDASPTPPLLPAVAPSQR